MVDSSLVGIFPQIVGMTNDSYALYIGLLGIVSSYIFFNQVTK